MGKPKFVTRRTSGRILLWLMTLLILQTVTVSANWRDLIERIAREGDHIHQDYDNDGNITHRRLAFGLNKSKCIACTKDFQTYKSIRSWKDLPKLGDRMPGICEKCWKSTDTEKQREVIFGVASHCNTKCT